ncbi:hypothetical protein [Blastococcus sp. LR1]|uniref:hypothetical protein n=1 Tax=Blastococcus sp. LR1 TaxID=2877000 RepID=UPI001CCF9B6F|nr:hypothetical protein [Blastococcus sp. LR1]MCA0145959.1 hypothetical protein [Blastococcus sp. LR1]
MAGHQAWPVWPAVLVDDDGWVDVLPGPDAFDIEPGYAGEVVAVFDRRGHRFRAEDRAGAIVLVADSDGPDVEGLTDHLNAATARWAPDLPPLRGASLEAALDRARVFDRRTRRRPRPLASFSARLKDRAVPREERRSAEQRLWDAVLQQAVEEAEAMVSRYEAALPGLDIGVTRGLDDRGVWSWGVHAFLLDGTRVCESWELLAVRVAGERDWTTVQNSESALARTEAALRAWARRPSGR